MVRAYYIDRIRVILTVMVIFNHATITYGGPGGWYYREIPATLSPSGIAFVLFGSVNQAYCMGFFFLLGGYFTPASYNHKGAASFLLGRLTRLGIPLTVFAVLLDPLASALAQASEAAPFTIRAFGQSYLQRVFSADWHVGPLWFAEALLLFSLAYMLWRGFRKEEKLPLELPLPSFSAWLLSALGVGASALLIRRWFPVGDMVMGLQLAYFASYVFLFALGTAAWRHRWLEKLSWQATRPWTWLSIGLLPVMLIGAYISGRFSRQPVNYAGGLSVPAVLYAFWEPLIAWGIIAAYLIWFRENSNKASRIWGYLSARAYATYILHSPVLVGICVALRPWQAPAMAKVAVAGTLAGVLTLGASSLLFRIPGARRIV
jgi:peptidoglycan/LPS O-acetylase OafA/YrhL